MTCRGNSAVLSRLIPPAFYPVHRALKAGRHLHYWLKGGRGSGKSSFLSLELLLGVMEHPGANGVVFRKVKNTLRDSVYAQLIWAARELGVAHLWKCTQEPMRMTFLPTGQSILFRGLDKAEKAKSLKAPEGYFGYVWFEELAEFSGMEEIRSVLQTALRGRGDFSVFYSYNPPKSARSWVNREVLERRPDRLVHHSTYLDLPRAWLGEQFLLEAEHLKAVRPELYRHEYLGEVIGTGTEVFHNLAFREISEEEIRLFPAISRGLDWGYAADPLHYACCWYDAGRRRLFIFHELHQAGLSNRETAARVLEEMALHGRGYVCCDSAEPKSIDDLYLLGVPAYGAKKGPDSVKWGVRFLSEEVEEIVIDPARCPATKREFYGYELELDREGAPMARYPDRDNHSIDAVRYALEDAIRAGYRERRRTWRFQG
mgnify:CR=1 FL=1